MRLSRLAALLTVLLFTLAMAISRGADSASATTGSTPGNPVPARYRVPHRIAVLYPGQYVLESAAPGTRLRHGQLEFELNGLGYLQGVGSFIGYDDQGYQSSWVATFYNFHLTAPNTMVIEIFDVTGTRLFGTLTLHRSKRGDLSGQIALPHTPYAIAFRRQV